MSCLGNAASIVQPWKVKNRLQHQISNCRVIVIASGRLIMRRTTLARIRALMGLSV